MDPDFLVMVLKGVVGFEFDANTGLTETVDGYSGTAYSAVMTVNSLVVKPVASAVIAIICTLELARTATSAEGDRQLGVRIVAATMFKMVLLIIAAQHVDLILGAIREIAHTLTSGFAQRLAVGGVSDVGSSVDWDAIRENLKNASVLDRSLLFSLLAIPWFISVFAYIALKIVVFLTFAEIYVLTAFATLAIAFLGHPETKQITITYLKRYAGLALKFAVLSAVVFLYATVFSARLGLSPADLPTPDSPPTAAWALSHMKDLIIGPIVFIILMFSSTKIARALTGEG
ncbi:type IV secretion system protein [Corynebacterium durum]|jgi:hypothetical protein